MTRYVGLIEGETGAYEIHFPDLPGCTSGGETVDEVIFNGAHALRQCVDVTEERGEVISAPRSFDLLRKDPDVIAAMEDGAILATVPLVRSIRSTGRPSKANLSIDGGILDAIDADADRRKLTRSAFIEAMAREMLPRMA